jgi:hypothetical protein
MEDIDTAETQFIWNKHGNHILTASSEKALEAEGENKQSVSFVGAQF